MKKKSNNRITHQVRISQHEALIIKIALCLLASSRPELYYDAKHYHRIFDRVLNKIIEKRLHDEEE